MNTDSPTYTLSLNSTQARVVEDSTRLYLDVLCGKIDSAAEELISSESEGISSLRRLPLLRDNLVACRSLATGLEGQNTHSIRSEKVPEAARVAADIHFNLRSQREVQQFNVPKRDFFPFSANAPKFQPSGDHIEISVDETALAVIQQACDLLSRVHLGQVEEIAFTLSYQNWESDNFRNFSVLKEKFIALRPLATGLPGYNAYLGIASSQVADKARIAFDIVQVVRHRLAWDRNPEGGWTVDFDTPLPTSQEPLATLSPSGAAAKVKPRLK